MMRRVLTIALLVAMLLLVGGAQTPAQAQQESTQVRALATQSLIIFTAYPAQMVEAGATINLPFTLKSVELPPQVVQLSVENLPEGWTATFRGSGHPVEAVYVTPDNDASVDLKIEPVPNATSGTYHFTVSAKGEQTNASLPIELTVEEKLPASLAMDVTLPTIKGAPTGTFRFDAKLKNDSDEELTVNLLAEAPEGFRVLFKSSGSEVTSLPLKPNESKSISIEASPFVEFPVGEYPITVRADGGDLQASAELTAEVIGQPELSVSAPDGRLSGQANAGRTTPLKIMVSNTGSAPAYNIEMSASSPNGWSATFNPERIGELPAKGQAEVTLNLKPADKAIAGDYMVTIRARPEDSSSKSVDFRITVLTSTIWGIAGIGLIAAAAVVVGLAVVRFGRR